jgi:hypothetical protein
MEQIVCLKSASALCRSFGKEVVDKGCFIRNVSAATMTVCCEQRVLRALARGFWS